MTDPEDSLQVLPSDLEEAEADFTDESERPEPLEAEPADVAEQKRPLGEDDDEHRQEFEF